MKNLGLHVFYLLIIGVLGFQLWSKTRNFESMNNYSVSTFKGSYEMSLDDNIMLSDAIRKASLMSPKYDNWVKQANDVKKICKSINHDISNAIHQYSTKKLLNIGEIKSKWTDLPKNLQIAMQYDDALDKHLLPIFDTLNRAIFWQNFERNPELCASILKNQIQHIERMHLNYLMDRFGCLRGMPIDLGFHVGIVPKRTSLIESDTFEAEVHFIRTVLPKVEALTLTIDNIEVPVVDGCARFSRIEKSKGLKKIRARAILPNIETGERHSIISEFEYHVLPKCSRDCQ